MRNNQRQSLKRVGSLGKVSRASFHLWEAVRRAFVEFLTIPSLVIIGFLLLAVIMFVIDERLIATTGGHHPAGLFSDIQASREFLGVIAASIITVTSITLSLLLIAVQQGAAALTSLVFDQFLRRRSNQFYFGFFIGLALYALIILATINPFHRPVYGVIVAGLMTMAALYMLIVLIYTTINQMRPVVIIKAIHDHTLLARERQLEFLGSTCRSSRAPGTPSFRVTADSSGYLARLDLAVLAKAAVAAQTEIIILNSIGDYVAYGTPIAEIRGMPGQDDASWQSTIRRGVVIEEQRDLDADPAFGIGELTMIAWTSISTAKSNPDPGLVVISNLRDLLARWLRMDSTFGAGSDREDAVPIVYTDNVPGQLMRAFESLAVVSSESMQHQCAAEIYRTFAEVFLELTPAFQQQASEILLRSLSGLGDHILTRDLDEALMTLSEVMTGAGHTKCADAISAARRRLTKSIGELHSRSTRATAGH
jgi:uncharacterized membrane protein